MSAVVAGTCALFAVAMIALAYDAFQKKRWALMALCVVAAAINIAGAYLNAGLA